MSVQTKPRNRKAWLCKHLVGNSETGTHTRTHKQQQQQTKPNKQPGNKKHGKTRMETTIARLWHKPKCQDVAWAGSKQQMITKSMRAQQHHQTKEKRKRHQAQKCARARHKTSQTLNNKQTMRVLDGERESKREKLAFRHLSTKCLGRILY